MSHLKSFPCSSENMYIHFHFSHIFIFYNKAFDIHKFTNKTQLNNHIIQHSHTPLLSVQSLLILTNFSVYRYINQVLLKHAYTFFVSCVLQNTRKSKIVNVEMKVTFHKCIYCQFHFFVSPIFGLSVSEFPMQSLHSNINLHQLTSPFRLQHVGCSNMLSRHNRKFFFSMNLSIMKLGKDSGVKRAGSQQQ